MMNSFGNYRSIDLFKKKKNFLNLEFELSLLLSEAVLKLLSIDSFSPFYPLLWGVLTDPLPVNRSYLGV
jgi:hypothetical protein